MPNFNLYFNLGKVENFNKVHLHRVRVTYLLNVNTSCKIDTNKKN